MPGVKTRYFVNCQHCGSPFETTPSRVARGQGTYCSKKCYGEAKRLTVEQRFLRHVKKTDTCWLWEGGLGGDGYPSFWDGVSTAHAHRVAWTIYRGPLDAGQCVLHNCPGGDNSLCVNPDHLWLGDRKKNHQDMVQKARHCFGSSSHLAKLTEEDVIFIRRLFDSGEATITELAGVFTMTYAAIYAIVHRKSWKHLP